MTFDRAAHEAEIDRNYDAFAKMLPNLMKTDAGRVALMRKEQLVGLFATIEAALRAGGARFPDRMYSVQEVTDEPLDLGVLSHVLGFRPS